MLLDALRWTTEGRRQRFMDAMGAMDAMDAVDLKPRLGGPAVAGASPLATPSGST
jgi:hypothetical protein